jgi:hypothetical protein
VKKYSIAFFTFFVLAAFTSCNKTLAPEPAYIDYYSMNMLDTAWFPASLPSGLIPSDRVYIVRSSYDGGGHISTPAMIKILKLDLTGIGQNNWDAFRDNISLKGEDLSGFRYIDLWLKADIDNPVNLAVDIGIISEDSNGNGLFELNINTVSPFVLKDSEDTNGNGLLESGEDTGISPGLYAGMLGSNPEYWGAGNAALDSEDMNKNGKLDTDEHFYRFSFPQNSDLQLPAFSPGWQHIKISLKNYSQAVGINGPGLDPYNPAYMKDVRHIRMIISGAGVSPSAGRLEFESISLTRN